MALGVASLVLTVSVAVGTVVGCVAGYYGERIDESISFLLNMVLTFRRIAANLAPVDATAEEIDRLAENITPLLAMDGQTWSYDVWFAVGIVMLHASQQRDEPARRPGWPF